MTSRYWRPALCLILAALWTGVTQAAGSWVATTPAVHAVSVERAMASAPMTPAAPEFGQGQIVTQISWRYQPPAGVEVNAWLCHPGACIPLAGPRGQTRALAGLPATTPLHFQFTLQDRRQGSVTLQGLQVIVNHERVPQS